jgi:spore germination cell wall hydrolase CwlJ-like protein
VVAQKKQFSYTRSHSFPKDIDALREATRIARHVINGYPDITSGATHYFNPDLAAPKWAGDLQYITKIGNHVFYK